jgi:ribose transport system ATP-binding protein
MRDESESKRSSGMGEKLLSLRAITKTYPGVRALDDVSLDFAAGEVHAIVGENGAGKSTLIKVISGATTPDSGRIVVAGREFMAMDPEQSLASGIAVIYQELSQFDSLSVAENIFIGERLGGLLVDFKTMRMKAAEILERFGVAIDPGKSVAGLTPAQRQIVEIAKAIHRKARVVIMDEPTAPLTMREVDRLFEVIRGLKRDGIAVIYISHRLEEVFAICDSVSVMRDGRYVSTMSVSETSRQELIALMVGRNLRTSYPRPAKGPAAVALEVKGISGNGVRNISFSVRKGEILGISGLVGAGRTELVRLVYGAERVEDGEIWVDGKRVNIDSTATALQFGIGLIPEDRKTQGAFLPMSVAWNISIASLRSLSRGLVVNRRAEGERAQEYRDRLRIKTPSLGQRVMFLSGGNQQKVVVAKTLAANTNILIFDEPTRGIDVGAREEIYELIIELANQGKAIIMVSSDMEELLGMSDRILVLAGGTLVGELPREEFDPRRVLELASGSARSEVAQ